VSGAGSQHTSIVFRMRCREAGVRPSMGSVGDCFDSAMFESSFATFEMRAARPPPLRPRLFIANQLRKESLLKAAIREPSVVHRNGVAPKRNQPISRSNQ
jgi:hypothetical protein